MLNLPNVLRAALVLTVISMSLGHLDAQENQDEAKARAERETLMDGYKKEMDAFQAFIQEQMSAGGSTADGPDPEIMAAIDKMMPKPEEWIPKFLSLANTHKGTMEGFLCLKFALTDVALFGGKLGEVHQAILDDHIQRPELWEIVVSMERGVPSMERIGFLESLSEKSPHKNIKGAATYVRALKWKERKEMVQMLSQVPEAMMPMVEKQIGKEELEAARKQKDMDFNKRCADLLEEVVTQYGDVDYEGGPLGKLVEKMSQATAVLAIGGVAPEIEGEDLDGVGFKLTDYRGKVIMLDFWGNW